LRVAIALGSNLGDRRRRLEAAVAALAGSVLRDVRVSRFVETDPDPPAPHPKFLNAALTGETDLSARDLLRALAAIESAAGRERPFPNAPRTIDLDLILYGEDVIDEPGLVVPHPRFRERRFVLEPLAEVAGDWRDPVTGSRIAELLERLGQ
jgi:2-amino-4-hydroxy-6-hydroxymethyldihydropteridine diphosphokinase